MDKKDNSKPVMRLAEYTDAPAIAGLLRASFDEYKEFYTKRAFTETTLGVYKIKERVYNRRTWVVLVNNIISATISLIPADRTLYVKSVAVAPAARRKGLAKGMMKHAECEAIAMGMQYLELTTTHFLKEAIALYENLGFEQRGYKDLYGTPLIRMVKYLARPAISGKKEVVTNHY